MEFLLFAIFFFLILIPLVLSIVIPIYKNHKKATNGIMNYDDTMRKFVYKVPFSGEEIINLLKTRNVNDELSYTFDFDKSIIEFSEYDTVRKYYFHIEDCNGFSILRLEQVELIGMQSHIPYKLNPFMVKKIQAEIIPFSLYGF